MLRAVAHMARTLCVNRSQAVSENLLLGPVVSPGEDLEVKSIEDPTVIGVMST